MGRSVLTNGDDQRVSYNVKPLQQQIGDMTKLDTTDKTSLVNALNEVKSEKEDSSLIGDLTELNTSDKSNLVAAINSNASELADISINIKQPPYNAKTNGTDDDSTAIINAIIDLINLGGGKLYLPNGTYLINQDVAFDLSKISVQGSNATIKLGNTNPSIVLQSGTTQDDTAHIHFFEGIEIVGNGSTVVGSVGIKVGKGTSNFQAFTTVRNCSIHDVETGILFASNSWLNRFENVGIYHTNKCVNFPSGLSNAGEEILFTNCVFYNSTYGIVANAGNIKMFGGSIDYIYNRFADCENGAVIVLNGVHIEGNSDNDYWLYCTGSMSVIMLINSEIYLAGNKSLYNIGYSGNTDGGITVDNVMVTKSTSVTYGFIELISAPSGSAVVKNLLPYGSAHNFVNGSDCLNYLIDGGFEQSTLVDWTLISGSVTPTFDTAVFKEGKQSLKFAPASGSFSEITTTLPCKPGDKPKLAFYMQATPNGTVDTISIIAKYLDRNGATINPPSYTATYTASTLPTTWTKTFAYPTRPAPAGTGSVIFYIAYASSGTKSDGKGSLWIDHATINFD